ncbi:Chemotaxis protein CheW [Acaryochloris thomasi RCC1774]|uniref:Chemotaxis protein CheW n=1 Tax=Acaryochloris thomasi RCC1774 TaxID=1764569 RepID=A0A2W1JQ27_9CYAN|nr:chemotaxis protein CheW [Acaryochloris thomasi]PZD75356.1 Chemotaxis protein CheW [Acaryochloris thomasi RCC1774]
MSTNQEFLTTNPSEPLPELQGLQNPEGDLYLRFFVESGQEFALPAMGIREVLSLDPEQITLVPNVSPLLMGILNLRGQVIWVTDIGQFLGDAQPLNTDRSEISIVAIETQEVTVGLAVERVMGMDWLDTEQLTLSTNAPDSMAPFLKGEWMMDGTHQSLRLLDPTAILRSARWAT